MIRAAFKASAEERSSPDTPAEELFEELWDVVLKRDGMLIVGILGVLDLIKDKVKEHSEEP